MKTIVFAYHDIGCIALTIMQKIGFNIKAIFTHHDDPNEKIFFSSVARLGAEMKIPVFAPSNINQTMWINHIKRINPDFIFSFYYRQILNQTIITIPLKGAFNLHNSLLPKYRGRSAINWVILHGETETGITLHKMTSKIDAGDIVSQKKIFINKTDTAISLHKKIKKATKKLLNDSLPLIKNNNYTLTTQDETKATYFPKRIILDGIINWHQSADNINNLIRSITEPYPGAFTYLLNIKIIIWKASVIKITHNKSPGTIICCNPLRVACKIDAIEILICQYNNSLYLNGSILATKLSISVGDQFNSKITKKNIKQYKNILILGVNGFIGSHLAERLLIDGNYNIYGIDINNSSILSFNKTKLFKNNKKFNFIESDISIQENIIKYYIKKCDIILPLVAIASPMEYVKNPLKVFELDFEENLKIVRYCVKYNKYIIFPSTSEVYGMCTDKEFDEYNSHFIVGPINKQRWIYSVSKQLLDRIIWAYGIKKQLKFTIFRPFNWIGPRLDNLCSVENNNSRVITQLILNLINGLPINLVDGGLQKRCFTDIKEGIEAIYQIIKNKKKCFGKIINIGNPNNNFSIFEIANVLINNFEKHKLRNFFPPFAGFKKVKSTIYYGDGYQDVKYRKPNIDNARYLLKWEPIININDTINSMLDYFLKLALDK